MAQVLQFLLDLLLIFRRKVRLDLFVHEVLLGLAGLLPVNEKIPHFLDPRGYFGIERVG